MWFGKRAERDFRDEIESHIRLEADRLIAEGVAPGHGSGAMALLQAVRSEISKVNPEILISDVITMRQQLDSTLLTERLLSGLSSVFGVLALILASVGLYGVLSHQIGSQRHSIGIRMALGATPLSIAVTVLSRSAIMLSVGLLCGLPFAFWATRTTANMLWGVKASDPSTYVVSAALLCAVGTISAYIPARRASAIDPAIALRHS
jgi:ABC-type antimicrobial peptide transport system permease subunit